MPTYEVCRFDQLIEGRGRPVRAGDRYLAAFLLDGEVYVLDNQCPHNESPLDGGAVIEGLLHCPWHGWAYDLETGDHVTAVGRLRGVNRYRSEVGADNVVRVRVEA